MPSTPDTRVSAVAGTLALVVAVILAGVVVTHSRLLLPVSLDLPSTVPGASDITPRFELSHVDLGLAIILLLVVSAAFRFANRMPGARWIEYGLVTPITTFLVAQLNGITDAGALIAIYSLTSAMVLFDIAQLREGRLSALSPWGLGTMVGIVPWGIIALHQVGGAVAGRPAPAIVQVITMSVLVLSAATSYGLWREFAGRATGTTYVALATATTGVFALEIAVAILTR